MKREALLLFLVLSISLIQAQDPTNITDEEKQELKPEVTHIDQCVDGYPYLSVGDFNLTGSNFSSVTQAEKALFVVVTEEGCDHCCKFEPTFAEIKDTILTNKTLLKGLDVKMARLKTEDYPEIKDKIKKLPDFLFYYKGESHAFEHLNKPEIVGQVLYKILHPYRTIETYEELQQFINSTIEVERENTTTQALKAIGIYSKNDDLKDEFKEFKKLANLYSFFRQLEFAVVTKQSVIDHVHRQYGTHWFPDYMKSAVLVVDRKNEVHKLEPTLTHSQLSDKIHMKGKDIVEPLTSETQELFRRLNLPMIVAFIDRNNTENFKSSLSILEEAAKKFDGSVAFAYLDSHYHYDKRKYMGIHHNKIPSLGITLPNSPSVFPFPEDREVTPENIKKFISDFFNRKLVAFDIRKIMEKYRGLPKHSVYQHLGNVEDVSYDNFDELVLKEGKDVFLLVIRPSEDPDLEQFCKNYDRMAERFKALGIDSVRITVYDLERNPPTPAVQISSTPHLAFLPAYQKKSPYKMYTDTPKTLPMMEYVEKYADIKFKLPELPHLPPELHHEYYLQKRRMEDEKLQKLEQEENQKDQKDNTEPASGLQDNYRVTHTHRNDDL